MGEQYIIDGLFFGFLPSWWYGNYGVTHGERMVFDPDYRTDVMMFMDRTLFERYPEFNIGSENPKPRVTEAIFSNALTPAAAGCEVVYPDDKYPWNKHLEPEKIEKLKPPESLMDVFPYNEIYSQCKYLNRKLNEDVIPFFNSTGILNSSVLIQGPEIFTDCYENPEAAERLFDYCCSMYILPMKHCYYDFNRRDRIVMPNCTHELIGTGMYEEWIVPFERKLYNLTNQLNLEFGIHHCGLFDRYADVYRKYDNIKYLDIGSDSNIKLALDKFPEATINYIFSAKLLAIGDRKTIRAKANQILEDSKGNWHRFRVLVADIEYGTPDENLYEIFECFKTPPKL